MLGPTALLSIPFSCNLVWWDAELALALAPSTSFVPNDETGYGFELPIRR